MRKLTGFFALFALLITTTVNAQMKQYVTWNFTQNKLANDEVELVFKAKMEKGWHLYSQTEVVDGPLPTLFEFEKSKDYKLVGKTSEPKCIKQPEPVFGPDVVILYFENEATFKQKIKVLGTKTFVVKGTIDGMTCNETQCQKFSPPVDFEFKIDGATATTATTTTTTVAETPEKDTTTIAAIQPQTVDSNTAKVEEIKKEVVVQPTTEKPEEKSWLGIFIAGFLGGFAALLTPCVFPMIPMTVSFFTKHSKSKAQGIKNASIYSFSIIAIYVILGLGVTLIFGADALNKLSTNVVFNLFFFALLVVFAMSFLGAFEIVLPSSLVNKMDSKSSKGGLVGIFFMAFTLGLVSFSCTGPIIGTLLVQAAANGAIAGPFWGMLGFSLALALPFGLFAAFPGWLNSLPKSGGWLNSVKVVLGFLELALAMKFLSNADLVYDAGIITREVFLISWIVIFGLLGAYLMGWFKLSHDSDVKHLSVGRLMLAIVSFMFTMYLIPGMWGAPLKLISGFPPPLEYCESPEWFNKNTTTITTNTNSSAAMPEHAHSGPNGIPAFDDYYLALEYSKKVNKPIMIDFTGKACINCRKMEAEVWSDPEVKRKLSEEFVLVSLYVDKKNELPIELQKEVQWAGKKRTLSSVGDRWMYLQNTQYLSATQPQYWIIDGNEKHYSDSTSYDPDIKKYINWLNKGLERYKKENSK